MRAKTKLPNEPMIVARKAATSKAMIKAKVTEACSLNNSAPGFMPCSIRAPRIIAAGGGRRRS